MLPPIFGVLFDGIAYGMLLFLLSVGLSVTLGLMNFVNLAHCAFAMIGGYVAVTLSLKKTGVPPGDATDAQMDAIADLADRFSFGELRVTHEQNLVFADVERPALPDRGARLAAVARLPVVERDAEERHRAAAEILCSRSHRRPRGLI